MVNFDGLSIGMLLTTGRCLISWEMLRLSSQKVRNTSRLMTDALV